MYKSSTMRSNNKIITEIVVEPKQENGNFNLLEIDFKYKNEEELQKIKISFETVLKNKPKCSISQFDFDKLIELARKKAHRGDVFRIESQAKRVLLEACETYIITLFKDANALAQNNNRMVVMQRDFVFAKLIKFKNLRSQYEL